MYSHVVKDINKDAHKHYNKHLDMFFFIFWLYIHTYSMQRHELTINPKQGTLCTYTVCFFYRDCECGSVCNEGKCEEGKCGQFMFSHLKVS